MRPEAQCGGPHHDCSSVSHGNPRQQTESMFPHSMDTDAAAYLCGQCGQSFPTPGALSFHTRSCKKINKRLASHFELAQEAFRAKKRRIQQVLAGGAAQNLISPPPLVPPADQLKSPSGVPEPTASDDFGDVSAPLPVYS